MNKTTCILTFFLLLLCSCEVVTPNDIKTPPALTGIKIVGDDSVFVGEKIQLSVISIPEGVAVPEKKWVSQTNTVATIDSTTGLLEAVKVGTTKIVVTAVADTSINNSLDITVLAKPTNNQLPTDLANYNSLKGKTVTTYGFADSANNNSGIKYANPTSIMLIDDVAYSSAVLKRQAFTDAIKTDTDMFIILSGDIDLSDGKISDNDKSFFAQFNTNGTRKNADIEFNIGSNTTIIGINNARIMFGGLIIKQKENVIIRNVEFYDAHGSTEKNMTTDPNSKASADNLNIDRSNNIWIDHCKFSDGICSDLIRNENHDGAFDIKEGRFITVSYCEFTNHDKVMLIAPNDTGTNVDSTLRTITLHHNYFHGVTQRNPRSRGTYIHIYNNYYNNIGVSGNSGYMLGPGVGSQYIVENNYFGSTLGTIVKYFDISATENEATFSRFYQKGNNVSITSAAWDSATEKVKDFSKHSTETKPFEITYNYTNIESAGGLNISVLQQAGVGKIGFDDL